MLGFRVGIDGHSLVAHCLKNIQDIRKVLTESTLPQRSDQGINDVCQSSWPRQLCKSSPDCASLAMELHYFDNCASGATSSG